MTNPKAAPSAPLKELLDRLRDRTLESKGQPSTSGAKVAYIIARKGVEQYVVSDSVRGDIIASSRGRLVKIVLPWDCCVPDNHKHIPVVQRGRARLILSPEYRQKKELAETLIMSQWRHRPKLTGELRLHARCFFPDLRRRDAGNMRKQITDSLTGIAYADDSQLVSETWERAGIDRERPRIELEISEVAA